MVFGVDVGDIFGGYDGGSHRLRRDLMARKASLGSHLEWHGSGIRVVVMVPRSATQIVGSTKLRENLKTNSPKAAETLKWPVVARLKLRIANAQKVSGNDPLTEEAFQWKETLAEAERNPGFYSYEDEQHGTVEDGHGIAMSALEDRAEQIEASHGGPRAAAFVAVAKGVATPVKSMLDTWIVERRYKGRTEAKQRLAVRRYTEWAALKNEPEVVEGVTRKVAGRYLGHLMALGSDPVTGNKLLSGLAGYWAWMEERGHFEGTNPWRGQRIPKDSSGARPEDGGGNKRPFTNDEVKKLLAGLKAEKQRGVSRAMLDICTASALTGGRIGELAELRHRHLDFDAAKITLPGEKSDNAFRTIPLHWPAAGFVDTEIRCFMKPEVAYAAKTIWA